MQHKVGIAIMANYKYISGEECMHLEVKLSIAGGKMLMHKG
jgi:hypothetical protein